MSTSSAVRPHAESAASAALHVAAAVTAFGVVHSLLASRRAKRLVERVFGERPARGGYRAAYNGVAVAMSAGLVAYVVRHRGPVVYALRGPAALLVRAGQLASVGVMVRASVAAGFPGLSGIGPVRSWRAGDPLRPMPDSQGPAERAPGDFTPTGAFLRTRNPLNFYAVPVLWLAPRATAGRVTLNAVATMYLLLGSWHANTMLAARHGEAWRPYERRVPLFVPRLLPSTGPEVP